MTADDIAALRQALAAGPTPGPWNACDWAWQDHIGDTEACGISVAVGQNETVIQTTAMEGDSEADVRYIAAASPGRIARLLDALELAQRDPEPAAWGVYVGDELMRPFGNLEQATEWACMEKSRGSGYTYHIRELYAARCFSAAMKEQA